MLAGALQDIDTQAKVLLDPSRVSGVILYAVLIGGLAWLIGRILGAAVNRLLADPRYAHTDRTAIKFLTKLVRLAIYLIAFFIYAKLIPALKDLGGTGLTSVGVVSVVFGLAAQNTLGNLVSGISLLLYRPFNLGDRLQVTTPVGLETGVVESLSLGYTVLRTGDDRLVMIPNSAMASQTSINLSLTDARKQCLVPVRISHAADVAKARQILLELAKQHPKTLEVIGCPVTDLGDGYVTLTLQVWCADLKTSVDLKNDLLERAKERFGREGIELFKTNFSGLLAGKPDGAKP